MNKKLIRKMLTASGGPIRRTRILFTPEQIALFESQATRVPGMNNSKEIVGQPNIGYTKPISASRVLLGRGVESDEEYTKRRIQEETNRRTWRSEAADVAHGIREGVLALHPYTAIPYYGAKVGQDFLNGTYGWHTALNASVPLFHFQSLPPVAGFREATNVALEDAANAGSKIARNWPFKPKLLTEHVQGNEAIKMFKEYGGEPIPEGSINGELLRKYVAEARERYGLVGNNSITDEEIAQALYKHSKELGGNTAAVNSLGEPQLLFRGDTKRYTLLKERLSPEELAEKSGTMDNSLGNLFLGELPYSWRGIDRYIGTWRNFNGDSRLVGSGTGSKVVWDGKTASEIEGFPYLGPQAGGGYKLYSQPRRYGNIDVYKLPASMMESGVNDLNAFIVRTPQMRNASSEISVLNDDWMLHGAKNSHFMSKNYRYNPKTYSMEKVKTGESLGEITTESAPESRAAMGDHYKELLKEAEQKLLGLLKSEANAPLRDEHSLYSYFALPNFNIQGAKHLLPYDLRIPRNWKDKNIYRGLIPITTGYSLYNLFNQPLQQLQYLKQGGKMNILEFLKNGSGIHIKKKNRGKFTSYCGGKVTDACIRKAKASGNPTLVKRATFADNARHFKHRSGGKIDFYNLGGWFKNISNNVGSFLNSDMGKSIMSTGSNLLSLGKGISDTGKNIDLINKINEEINAEEAAAKLNSFAKKFATILLEKLSKPDIDVNGSPIHTNGVNVTNEAYNQAVNTFNFDNSMYNLMRYLNKMRGQQIQNQTSTSMMGSVNNLINSIGGISESVLNNNKSTTT